MEYFEAKKSTDKWFPVRLVDATDGHTGEAGITYDTITVVYSYEASTAGSFYIVGVDDWKEDTSVDGNYWIRIGADEFSSNGKYVVTIIQASARRSFFSVEVRSFTKEEEYTGSNVVTIKYKTLNVTNSHGTAVVFESSGNNGAGIDIIGNGTSFGTRMIGGVTSGSGLLIQGRGTGNGLDVVGANNGISINTTAGNAIDINTTTGNGIDINSTNTGNGISINTFIGNGIDINTTSAGHGININTSNADSISIYSGNNKGIDIFASDKGINITSDQNSGIAITGGSSSVGVSISSGGSAIELSSNGYLDDAALEINGAAKGISINTTTGNGVEINTTTGNGIDINTTSGHGIDITSTLSGNGIDINTSGAKGISIETTTGDGIEINTTSGRGIDINTTSGHGINISSTTTAGIGIDINTPAAAGISIQSGLAGIYVNSQASAVNLSTIGSHPALLCSGATGVRFYGSNHGIECIGNSGSGLNISGNTGLTISGTVDDINIPTISSIKTKTDNLPTSPANEDTLTTIASYIDTEVAAIKAKTDNLPADPASDTTVNTRLATAGYTAPDNASITSIKAVTDVLTEASKLNALASSGVTAKVHAIPINATTIVLKTMSNTSANMNNENLIKNNILKFINGACQGQVVGITAQSASASEPYTFTVTPMINWNSIQVDDDVIIT